MEPTSTFAWILALVVLQGTPVGDFNNLVENNGCFAAREKIMYSAKTAPPAQIVCVPAPNNKWDMIALYLKGDALVAVSNGNYAAISGGEYSQLTGDAGCSNARDYVMKNKGTTVQAVCIHTNDGALYHQPR